MATALDIWTAWVCVALARKAMIAWVWEAITWGRAALGLGALGRPTAAARVWASLVAVALRRTTS
eukprot:scaffold53833_cov14-Tisochrysis_lutea.AAC.1